MGQYANGVHVVYIPFTQCQEELDAVGNWNTWNSREGRKADNGEYQEAINTFKRQRRFEAVTQAAPLIPADLAFAASAENVMYVLGHCSAGCSTLSATEGGEEVTAKELAKRVAALIGDANFPGGIKIYGCDSAKGSFLSLSFARNFAQRLIDKYHYNHCTIYGYVECVSNYQPAVAWDKEGDVRKFHKVVKLDAKHIQAVLLDWMTDKKTTLRRAGEARVIVAQNGAVI